MTNVELVERAHRREAELSAMFGSGKKDSITDAWRDVHHQMSLDWAKRQDAMREASAEPSALKITSEVKVKR